MKHSKVNIGNYFADSFPAENCLKQGNASSSLLSNFVFVHAIRKVEENQVGLKLDGSHGHLAYADDSNLLEDSTVNVKINAETLIDASKAVGLEINTEKVKVKYVLLSQCRSKS
jgi:hypothetical protein